MATDGMSQSRTADLMSLVSAPKPVGIAKSIMVSPAADRNDAIRNVLLRMSFRYSSKR